MSLGEVRQVSEDVYAYLQPDGSWYWALHKLRAFLRKGR